MMAAVTVGIAAQRDLFSVIILSSIYSFLLATVLVGLDAVDVGMTEAAVGAGVPTVLFLSALHLTGTVAMKQPGVRVLPALAAFATAAMLVYGTLDLPAFSDPEAPIHKHVAPRYIEDAPRETGVPNIVTAVLASYRGYDTLGETAVVFTAGIGIIALLRRRRTREKGPES
jgi:multicomponent Na+:H+ antiporter subunit B